MADLAVALPGVTRSRGVAPATNAQIAARPHRSARTVEKHVSSALAKLVLGSRAGITALLARA